MADDRENKISPEYIWKRVCFLSQQQKNILRLHFEKEFVYEKIKINDVKLHGFVHRSWNRVQENDESIC